MNHDVFLFLLQSNSMRLGERFASFGNKVKQFGLRAGSTLAHVAPKVLKVGSFVAGGLSNLPGTIGTAAGFIHRGLDAANRLIESLPNSSFKSKLQDLSSKANNTVNTIEPKVNNAARTAQVIGDTAGKVIDSVKHPPVI